MVTTTTKTHVNNIAKEYGLSMKNSTLIAQLIQNCANAQILERDNEILIKEMERREKESLGQEYIILELGTGAKSGFVECCGNLDECLDFIISKCGIISDVKRTEKSLKKMCVDAGFILTKEI